ncbi:hypothetical protein [Anabaena azotica]|uniref:hypothetical protein n=1 Tax=Anabaena azotica TaxID=197653 RepID=UPI0039A40307
MTQAQIIDLEQGLLITQNWLKEAGLGDRVQVVIQQGEIRISSVDKEEWTESQEDAWNVFLSLEQDAPSGQVADVSTNHDQYLYQK